MAERHPARRQVSPMLVGRKLDAAVASKRFQHLGFNQRRSSAGSAYDASSMPQQLLLLKQTQMNSLEPLQAENRQGEALYRVRIVDTRTYPRLYADEQHWARTRPNVL
jgi:hypothetical protein